MSYIFFVAVAVSFMCHADLFQVPVRIVFSGAQSFFLLPWQVGHSPVRPRRSVSERAVTLRDIRCIPHLVPRPPEEYVESHLSA